MALSRKIVAFQTPKGPEAAHTNEPEHRRPGRAANDADVVAEPPFRGVGTPSVRKLETDGMKIQSILEGFLGFPT